jgi:hypothetical protein
MSKLTLRRRRKRRRVASAVERTALRVITALWLARLLVRHALNPGR